MEENTSFAPEDIHDTSSFGKSTCTDGATYEEMQKYVFARWIVEGILLIVINFIGLISNSIAIPVLLSRQLSNRFNRILAILAGFDAAYNFLDILESIRGRHYEHFSDNTCGPTPYYIYLHDYLNYRILLPLQSIVMMASIYTTVFVAFERYVAVSKPISVYMQDGSDSWKKVMVYITSMLAFTIAFNLPKFFEFCATEIPMSEMECAAMNNYTSHELQCPADNTGPPYNITCNYFVYADLNVKGKSWYENNTGVYVFA